MNFKKELASNVLIAGPEVHYIFPAPITTIWFWFLILISSMLAVAVCCQSGDRGNHSAAFLESLFIVRIKCPFLIFCKDGQELLARLGLDDSSSQHFTYFLCKLGGGEGLLDEVNPLCKDTLRTKLVRCIT